MRSVPLIVSFDPGGMLTTGGAGGVLPPQAQVDAASQSPTSALDERPFSLLRSSNI